MSATLQALCSKGLATLSTFKASSFIGIRDELGLNLQNSILQ